MVPSSSPVMIHRLNGRFDYICRWWWRRISIYWRLRSEVPILVMMMMTLRSTIGDRVARAFKRSGSRACHGMGMGITMYTYGMGLYRMMMMAWLGGCVDLGLSLGLGLVGNWMRSSDGAPTIGLKRVRYGNILRTFSRNTHQELSYLLSTSSSRLTIPFRRVRISAQKLLELRSLSLTLNVIFQSRSLCFWWFFFSVSSVFHLITVWTPTRCQ